MTSSISFVVPSSKTKTDPNVTLFDVPLLVLTIRLVRVTTTVLDLKLGNVVAVTKVSLSTSPGCVAALGLPSARYLLHHNHEFR